MTLRASSGVPIVVVKTSPLSSLNYYFTRLWLTASGTFWKSFWHFLPRKDLHLRLIAQLVPTTVVAKEARGIDQLNPLISALAESEPLADDAVLRMLRALEATTARRDELWILFLEKVSDYPHGNFVGLLSWLTADILKRSIGIEGSNEIISKCGAIGRRLLRWIWDRRKERVEGFLDSIGAISLVPLVAQTYGTSVESSRTVLEPVLSLTKQPNYPIDYLYRLSHELDKIWTHDPEFVARIYSTVFSSYETSQDPTNMGTPVLRLISTRRQDYEMCRYILIEYFPRFLLSLPQTASRMAITILNKSVLADHVVPYLKEGAELKDLIDVFSFRGKQSYYIPDLSYIWSDQHYSDYLKMGNALFEYVAELTSKDEIESMLDIFRDEAWVAYFWGNLLTVGARKPTILAPYLFELCFARPIQTGSETVWQLGNFLKVAMAEFTEEQQLTIEQSLLSLSEEDSEDKDRLEHLRNRLLGSIPAALLKTDKGISLLEELEKTNAVPQNRPLSSFESFSRAYTHDDWLRDQGADPEKPENKAFRLLSAPLDKFDKEWQNKIPSLEAIQAILPAQRAMYEALQAESNADQAVIDSAWTDLAASAETTSRGIKSAEMEEYHFCREVLIQSSRHHLPEPAPDADSKYNTPSWSPSPRTEAAQGLPWLAIHATDEELLYAIEALTRDNSPSVRFLITTELFRMIEKAPGKFWGFVNSLADNERNGVVLYALCNSIGRIIWNNEQPAVEILQKLAPSARTQSQYREFMNYFVSLIMWLVLDRQNEWAIQEAKFYITNPHEFALPLQHAVLDALSYITPENIKSSTKGEIAERAIDWILNLLPHAGTSMKSLLADLEKEPSEEKRQTLRNVYGVFDEIVTRLCFTADVIHHLRQQGNTALTNQQRCDYYFKVKPLLEGVLRYAADEKTGLLFAHTAHRFMELLNGVLPCDPQGVIHMASAVAQASEFDNFNIDPMAAEEVVKLVEAILADHREAVVEGEPLQDLLSLLDIFAKAGWPAALRLVWRLDEIFR